MSFRIIIPVCFISLILGFSALYLYSEGNRLPENRPEVCQKTVNTSRVIVSIGDSITQGSMSANYVDILELRFSSPEYTFINAGINAELSYNVLFRLENIISCDPDYITILIGSNDVLALLSDKAMKNYIKKQDLPRLPNRQWFEDNLTRLVEILQKKTNAQIALLSLPPVTENQSHPAYKTIAIYSEIIRQVALDNGIVYLPLFEEMDDILKNNRTVDTISFESGESMALYKALARHYLFGKSWDEISEDNGLTLLTDNIHLNNRSAELVADLIEDFIINHPPLTH